MRPRRPIDTCKNVNEFLLCCKVLITRARKEITRSARRLQGSAITGIEGSQYGLGFARISPERREALALRLSGFPKVIRMIRTFGRDTSTGRTFRWATSPFHRESDSEPMARELKRLHWMSCQRPERLLKDDFATQTR